MKYIFTLIFLLLFISCDDDSEFVPPDYWNEGLNEGINYGIAQNYPEDEGINNNKYVIAAENFESGEVLIKTEEDRYKNNVIVSTENPYTGKYSAKHSWTEGYNGPTTRYLFSKENHNEKHNAYFVRMCFVYDESFHPGESFAGVGVKGFGIYYEGENTNVNTPCDGTNWYNASVQFVGWGPSQKEESNNGYLWVAHLYSYNPAPEKAVAEVGELNISEPQTGDKPYRFSVYQTPFDYIQYGEWNCYEVGLYLNTPKKYDGEARFWVNGVLASRVTNMRFRDLEDMYPQNVNLNLHRVTENFPQTMFRYVDNIVIAKRYIGPVKLKE